MSRRNTISREFFATIAAVLVLGLSVMCAIQTALSAAHFISERKSSLTDVLNGATALSERFADEGSIVTRPLQGEDLVERAHSGFELFNTTSGALIFIADKSGSILLHTGDEAFTGANVPPAYIVQLDEGSDIFETGTLDGVYNAKYYTAGRRITVGGQDGYLFAASPMNALGSYMTDMLAMFGISAAAILLLCSVLCWVLARRITGPIEDISEAARRLGSGLLTRTMACRHELSFASYDRLFPTQDTVPKGGFGNLIALPFQGQAQKEGNTLFVDEQFVPYPDQWAFLSTLPKVTPEQLTGLLTTLCQDGDVGALAETAEKPVPWQRKRAQRLDRSDFPLQVTLTLSNLIYLDKAGFSQAALNMLKRLAAFPQSAN